jgi:conjugative transfer signal peptidase TraF
LPDMSGVSCYHAARSACTKIAAPARLSRYALGGVLGALCTWGLLRVIGLTLNLSGSMPVGLYAITREPLQVGQIVAVCLPPTVAQFGRARGYLATGACASGTQAVLKIVAAAAGTAVDVQPEGLTINGRPVAHSAVLARDSHARELPHMPWGSYTIAPGELWLLSTYDPRSWDSRYYGPVPITAVIATARPVLVLP